MSSTSDCLSATIPLVWFITGTSQGFGSQLVRAALQRGDFVVATSLTVVEPGPSRTDFLGGSLAHAARKLPEYGASAGKTRVYATENDGGQAGDPALGAEAIVKAITAEKPPLHLLLGKLAYERANAKLEAMEQEFAAWHEVTFATDLPT